MPTGSKRSPKKKDPPYIVARRLRNAEEIRAILYGAPEGAHAPLQSEGATCRFTGRALSGSEMRERRMMSWAWKFKLYVKTRQLTVEQMRGAAREMVAANGGPFPSPPTLGDDVILLNRWQERCKDLAGGKDRFKRAEAKKDPKHVTFRNRVADQTKRDLLMGVCPLCGSALPCKGCGVTRYKRGPGTEIVPVAGDL